MVDKGLFAETSIISSGQQYELLDWLANVTFPMEERFADIDFARRAYDSVVSRVLNCGVCLLAFDTYSSHLLNQ